jgi:thiol-disulfide isomerase/thioredoxin
MEEEIFLNNDTTYVINFWATWCKPCVKELPYFESLHRSAGKEKMKVILVSLDFRNQVESKLKPFIRDNNYSAKVILLLDSKYNSWIDKVEKNWSGSIPSTLLIKGDKRLFAETEFENEQELRDFVYSFINSQ